MSELFLMILFENKHNAWLIPFVLLKHQCKSSFMQNYIKIRICDFIAVKYMSLVTRKPGERTGLVVRALDSGSGDPGSILGRVGVLFP